ISPSALYTLSLHDALPISLLAHRPLGPATLRGPGNRHADLAALRLWRRSGRVTRRQLEELHGGDLALRAELHVSHRGTAAVSRIPQVPEPEGRTVRGRHRLDAVHAGADRLRLGTAPLV